MVRLDRGRGPGAATIAIFIILIVNNNRTTMSEGGDVDLVEIQPRPERQRHL